MARTREQLENEARDLPREERVRLAEALIASLEEETEIDQAWNEEIRGRLAELEAGTVETFPAETVLAELDEIVGGK